MEQRSSRWRAAPRAAAAGLRALGRGFAHGVHPAEHKERSAQLAIQRAPFVSRYVMPLDQHLGVPAQPVVQAGERVRRGQPIARPGAFVSVALHSPVTGRVRAVEPRRDAGGELAPAIEIEADPFATQRPAARPPVDWRALSTEQFTDHLRQAGIVGLGGAAFPTHVKLTLPPGKRIERLVANGAECEPYLTCDHRLMVERPAALLRGIEMVRRQLGARHVTIGVEANKPDAIAALRRHLTPQHPVEVVALRVKYPQGAEKMLLKTLFGLEVPAGGLPRDVGVTVSNIGTLVAVADYFDTGLPLVERVVTVSGPGVAYPANLIVPLGTPVRDVLRFCGGLSDDTRTVVMGGPMMGTPLASLDVPVVKGTSGLLAFTEQEARAPRQYPCLRCGRCVRACPHFLNPSRLARLAQAGRYEEMREWFVDDCVESGCCTYSCPSGIAIVQLIRTAKAALRGVAA